MAVNKAYFLFLSALTSACQAKEAVSLREISGDSAIASLAASKMHKDNPDTLAHRNRLNKIYHIEGKYGDCVWFVYDPKVGFNDAEFLYCIDRTSKKVTRL
jgi:hypothetical protein